MTGRAHVRAYAPSDRVTVEALYREAFSDEDLMPLLRDLLVEDGRVRSLVAIVDDGIAGHIAVTSCGIDGSADLLALLGPLAVDPPRQRQGIGGALVQEALRYLKADGAIQVQVLGDPAYYSRFGFRPDADLEPPYPLPKAWREAWQMLRLRMSSPPLRGTLSVPKPWQRAALWAP